MQKMKVKEAIKLMKSHNTIRSWVPGLGYVILDQNDLDKALENSIRSNTGETNCLAYVNEDNEFCIGEHDNLD